MGVGRVGSVGERVRWWREVRGLSIDELGDAAGVSRSTVQRIEVGVTVDPRLGSVVGAGGWGWGWAR